MQGFLALMPRIDEGLLRLRIPRRSLERRVSEQAMQELKRLACCGRLVRRVDRLFNDGLGKLLLLKLSDVA